MEEAEIRRSKSMDTPVQGKYSIWRRDYESPNSDSILRLMRDQIIMAKAYANIAKTSNETILFDSLIEHSRESLLAIGGASSDIELDPRALDQAKTMGRVLSMA